MRYRLAEDPHVILPTGTVAFLFTDIEGSTRLWEDHPDAMRAALARHNAIIAEADECALAETEVELEEMPNHFDNADPRLKEDWTQ
jgi:class 3 adenylate cyclase